MVVLRLLPRSSHDSTQSHQPNVPRPAIRIRLFGIPGEATSSSVGFILLLCVLLGVASGDMPSLASNQLPLAHAPILPIQLFNQTRNRYGMSLWLIISEHTDFLLSCIILVRVHCTLQGISQGSRLIMCSCYCSVPYVSMYPHVVLPQDM